MQILTPEDHQRLQTELSPGELLLWAGRPTPKLILSPREWIAIPVSILWSIAVVIGFPGELLDGIASDKPLAAILLLVALIGVTQYAIWGRFLHRAAKKRRVLYFISDRRVVVSIRPRGHTIEVPVTGVRTFKAKVRQDGIGTLIFGSITPWWYGRNAPRASDLYLTATVPIFVEIEDAQAVCTLVSDLRARTA